MFSGIGGFEIPLQELGLKCVEFSEMDKDAVPIYHRHFPTHKSFGLEPCQPIAPSPGGRGNTGAWPKRSLVLTLATHQIIVLRSLADELVGVFSQEILCLH